MFFGTARESVRGGLPAQHPVAQAPKNIIYPDVPVATPQARIRALMVKVVRASQIEIEAAVQALRDGELVAFPTETVYGLGANASNPAAVRKVFELKDRPPSHPVIVHIDQQKYLRRWVRE